MFAWELVWGFDDGLKVVKAGASCTNSKLAALEESRCPWVVVVSNDARGDLERLDDRYVGGNDDELEGTLSVPVLHLAKGEVLGVIRREAVLEILRRGDVVPLDRVERGVGVLSPRDGVVAVLEALRDHGQALVEYASETPAFPAPIGD